MDGHFICATVNDAMAAEKVVPDVSPMVMQSVPAAYAARLEAERRPREAQARANVSAVRSTTCSSHSRPHQLLRHLPCNSQRDPPSISRSSNSRSLTLDTASHVTSATSEVTGRPTMPVNPRIYKPTWHA